MSKKDPKPQETSDAALTDEELEQTSGGTTPCFVKSWSTSGDADDRPTEEVAFYYNRIAFNYARSGGEES